MYTFCPAARQTPRTAMRKATQSKLNAQLIVDEVVKTHGIYFRKPGEISQEGVKTRIRNAWSDHLSICRVCSLIWEQSRVRD
jgi:hypothetical protein